VVDQLQGSIATRTRQSTRVVFAMYGYLQNEKTNVSNAKVIHSVTRLLSVMFYRMIRYETKTAPVR
jgi:hypothetical protein